MKKSQERLLSTLKESQECRKELTIQLQNGTRREGFVIATELEWILVRCTFNFLLDGYEYIRISQIAEVKNRGEFIQRIWRRDFSMDEVFAVPEGHSPETLHSFLKMLRKKERLIAIEMENRTQEFILGYIYRLSRDTVYLDKVSPSGRFNLNNPHSVRFETINVVGFGNSYTVAFERHLKPRKPRE